MASADKPKKLTKYGSKTIKFKFKMHIYLLPALLGAFVSTKAAKSRSVNVAIDTVLEFDKASDVEFINQVQRILNKLKNVSNTPNPDDNAYAGYDERNKFSETIEDALDAILAFDDEDLKEIVQIVDNEIRKHIHDYSLEETTRKLLIKELDLIKIKPMGAIRKNLNKLLTEIHKAIEEKDNYSLDFINSLYKSKSEKKLAKFVRELKMFRRSSGNKVKLEKTVRKAVRFIVFGYISNLPRIETYFHNIDNDDRINNKFKPEMVQQDSAESELSKEEFAMKDRIKTTKEILTETENIQDKLYSTETIFKKFTIIPNQIKNAKVKYENTKLSHTTSTSPQEYLGIENGISRDVSKATVIVKEAKKKTANSGNSLEDFNENSNAQINIKYKNNKIQLTPDNNDNIMKDTLMKVRAFRKKMMKSTATINNKGIKRDFLNLNSKRNDIAKTKISDQLFGKQFRKTHNKIYDKRDSRRANTSNIDHAREITELLSKIEYQDIDYNTMLTKQKFHKHRPSTVPSDNIDFRTTKEFILDNSGDVSNKNRKTIEHTENKDILIKDFNVLDELADNLATTEVSNSNDIGHRRAQELDKSFNKIVNNVNETSEIKSHYEQTSKSIAHIMHNTLRNNNGLNAINNLIIKRYNKTNTQIVQSKSSYEPIQKPPETKTIKLIVNDITKEETAKNNIINYTKDMKKNHNKVQSGSYNKAIDSRRDLKPNNTKLHNLNKILNINNKMSTIININDKLKTAVSNDKNSFTKTKQGEVENKVSSKITTIVNDNKYKTVIKGITPIYAEIKRSRGRENTNHKTTAIVNLKESELGITNIDPTLLHIKEFIKNPRVLDIDNEEKKKEIEEQMKEDLEKLFIVSTTNATTDAYTDIFEAMDDAFDLNPLK